MKAWLMKSTDERMAEVLGRARTREAAVRGRRRRSAALGGGTFGLLCLAMAYHGLFNLLVAAGDPMRIAAIAMPLATLAAILAARHGRERRGARR